jgi:hypothetical protein
MHKMMVIQQNPTEPWLLEPSRWPHTKTSPSLITPNPYTLQNTSKNTKTKAPQFTSLTKILASWDNNLKGFCFWIGVTYALLLVCCADVGIGEWVCCFAIHVVKGD